MPLIKSVGLGNGTLLLWSIEESEEQLRGLVGSQDMLCVDGISSRSRRVERLAWRAALRSVEPLAEVSYDKLGRPHMRGGRHIAVSHCRAMAVVMLGEDRCAVDVEPIGRDLTGVSGRFIAQSERALDVTDDPLFNLCVWCAKEAMYKYSGRDGLDFLKDLHVTGYDPAGGVISGNIAGGEELRISLLREGAFLIAYI